MSKNKNNPQIRKSAWVALVGGIILIIIGINIGLWKVLLSTTLDGQDFFRIFAFWANSPVSDQMLYLVSSLLFYLGILLLLYAAVSFLWIGLMGKSLSSQARINRGVGEFQPLPPQPLEKGSLTDFTAVHDISATTVVKPENQRLYHISDAEIAANPEVQKIQEQIDELEKQIQLRHLGETNSVQETRLIKAVQPQKVDLRSRFDDEKSTEPTEEEINAHLRPINAQKQLVESDFDAQQQHEISEQKNMRDQLLRAEDFRQRAILQAEEIKRQALVKIRDIEIKRMQLKRQQQLKVREIDEIIKKAREEAYAHLKETNRLKRNVELLRNLDDEQLLILANENNISLPVDFTYDQKVDALKEVDATRSPGLKTLLILERQKKQLLADARKEQELNAQYNSRKVWALEQGQKIKAQFEREMQRLDEQKLDITEHQRAIKTTTLQKLSLEELEELRNKINRK